MATTSVPIFKSVLKTHVDSLDIITEEFLDLLTLDGGVDNDIVSGSISVVRMWQKRGSYPLFQFAGVVIYFISFFSPLKSRMVLGGLGLTLYLSPSCKLSITLKSSGKFLSPISLLAFFRSKKSTYRPVEAG
jgi:hypothetical protein